MSDGFYKILIFVGEVLISIAILVILLYLFIIGFNLNEEEPDTVVKPVPVVVEEEITLPKIDEQELVCLAENIYHESRSELLIGQYAVADVVLNRVESTRYPNTICEVVYQARLSPWGLKRDKIIPLRNQCQFSWYCDGKTDTINDSDAYARAEEVAYNIMYENKYRHITEHSTHYHTRYVNPSWNTSMHLVGTIGNHIFYIEN